MIPPRAAALLPKIMDVLRRAIECGATIDPWNILGFDAHFSLFPSLENSVHDHRADDLCLRMENIFGFYSQVWSEAAARDDQALSRQVSLEFNEVVNWWHQFATHEVSSVEAVNAMDAYRAAERVAGALNLWHKGGAAAGDVAFWAPHAEMFDSCQAYSLVLETLLKKNDFVAAMALLVHWLGQAERVGLESGESSFHRLSEYWLQQLLQAGTATVPPIPGKPTPAKLVQKFFDYLEANAETFWHIPRFELAENSLGDSGPRPNAGKPGVPRDPDEDDEEGEELFDAAYESVVYRDTTDDGIEGAIFETGDSTRDELTHEYRRISSRLAFHSGLARMWRTAALSPVFVGVGANPDPTQKSAQLAILKRWSEQAAANYDALLELLDIVRGYRIPAPNASHEAMIEFDQKRLTKEAILGKYRFHRRRHGGSETAFDFVAEPGGSQRGNGEITRGRTVSFRSSSWRPKSEARCSAEKSTIFWRIWPNLLDSLQQQPLLYVSFLAKGGKGRARK